MQNTAMFEREQDYLFAFMISKENDDRLAMRDSQIIFIPLKTGNDK